MSQKWLKPHSTMTEDTLAVNSAEKLHCNMNSTWRSKKLNDFKENDDKKFALDMSYVEYKYIR